MSPSRVVLISVAAVLAIVLASPKAWPAAPSFQGLGVLPGYASSVALAVSGDGSVVVGESDHGASTAQPFRWTSGGGMQGLGHLPGDTSGTAIGVSGDGSVVVGLS